MPKGKLMNALMNLQSALNEVSAPFIARDFATVKQG